MIQESPAMHGQWAGPYVLPIGSDLTTLTFEIAHGLLLPPPVGSDEARVLFGVVPCSSCELLPPDCTTVSALCWAPVDPGKGKYGRTYTWSPDTPTLSRLIPSPYSSNCPDEVTEDFFCGGHVQLPDGDVLWVGGTDPQQSCGDGVFKPGSPVVCEPTFYGHCYAWRLDISTPIPTWSSAGLMFEPRWYPTATLLPGERVMVTGHDLLPNPLADETYDLYDLATSSWQFSPTTSAAWPNWPKDVNCDESDRFPLQDYPRLHVLSSGWLMQSNASSGDAHHPMIEPSRFMDLTQPEACSNGELRWQQGSTASAMRVNGNSLHLVVQDDAFPSEFDDVVYITGGALEAMELEDDCVAAAAGDVFDTCEKMVEPSPSASWVAAPSMRVNRVQQNTVILLDGSFLAIGGHGIDTTGTCSIRRRAERYEPVEVFDDPNASWQWMAKQTHDRRYHSVAVLLPDGRVVSAGGNTVADPGASDPASQHSVEVYSPPYFFNGARPVIDATTLDEPHTQPYDHGEPIEFQVEFRHPDRFVERVALVRTGAATHAFDQSQRYVELDVDLFETQPSLGDPLVWDVKVTAPKNELAAPNGFYMLTVIDDRQIPSEAAWIRLEEQ